MPRSSTRAEARTVFNLSWLALRAGVLRRAVSHWRPVLATAAGEVISSACVGRTRMPVAVCTRNPGEESRTWATPQEDSKPALAGCSLATASVRSQHELRNLQSSRHSHRLGASPPSEAEPLGQPDPPRHASWPARRFRSSSAARAKPHAASGRLPRTFGLGSHAEQCPVALRQGRVDAALEHPR
jgi:hypothetical protein